jgi:hypothetical protein
MNYVCKNHLLQTEFTTPERKCLNRVAVPCGSDSASQDPTWHVSDLNPLCSLLSLQKNLHVQPPQRTYGEMPLSSSSIQTLLSIHEGSLCTSSKICAVKSTPLAAKMFGVEDTSSPLNLNASDGDFRHTNHPDSSSKPRASHSLIKSALLLAATMEDFHLHGSS